MNLGGPASAVDREAVGGTNRGRFEGVEPEVDVGHQEAWLADTRLEAGERASRISGVDGGTRARVVSQLQRRRGNSYVNRMLAAPGRTIQRQAVPEPSPSPAPREPDARRYNVRIGSDVLTNATEADAILVLRRHYQRIRNWVDAEEDAHRSLRGIRDDQWIVGFFADTLGGVTMPPLSMWAEPRVALDGALSTIEAGAVDASVRNLRRAEEAYQRCHRQFVEYRDGTISGAETSVTVLEVTAAAGAVAATLATGGIAAEAGLGLLGSSATIGAVGGAYGATQELAGQTGEGIVGTRHELDLGRILRRGAVDAVTNFVGAFVGGSLSRYMTRFFGSYLSNLGDDVLIQLGEELGLGGPLPRDYFVTQGQRFVADFLGGVGSAPLTTACSTVVNRLTGGGSMPSPEQFAEMVFHEMLQAGIMHVFLGAIMHGHGAGESRRPPGAPETPPPEVGPSRAAPEPPRPGTRAAESRPEAPSRTERWTPEEMARMTERPEWIEGFAGGEGVALRTEGVAYVVRIGEAGEGGGGKWADHLFATEGEARAYAEWVARTQPEEVARAIRAIPHQWVTGGVSRFQAVKVCEVPAGTAYLQGPIAPQPEGAARFAETRPGMSPEQLLEAGRRATRLPGGGMQVLIDPSVRVRPVGVDYPIQPGGDASGVVGVMR